MASHKAFAIVFVLFVTLRLGILAFFLPAGPYATGSDHQVYYEAATLVDGGLYPYLHWWSEYPPLFPWLSTGLYLLGQLIQPGFLTYDHLLSAVMLGCECGTLALVYLIGTRVHGKALGLQAAWIYSLCFLPLYIWQQGFDPLVVFLAGLALYYFLEERYDASAVVVGIGAMVKLWPALIVLVVLLTTLSLRQRWRYAGLAGVTMGLIALPFLLASPDYTLASFANLLTRGSWETVWALFDGYLGYGAVGDLAARLDPSLATVANHSARLPGAIPLLLFLLALGYLFVRLRRIEPDDASGLVKLTAVLVVLFLLTNRGWSPQYLTWLLPLLIVLWPDGRGVAYIIGLSLFNFMEWVAVGRPDTAGELLVVSVVVRTGLLLLLLADVGRRLPQVREVSVRLRLGRWLPVPYLARDND